MEGSVQMAITREEVLHVARLARLELSEDEVTRFQEQLSAILDAVSKVSELDLSDVPPTSHPLGDRERLGRGRAAAVPAARRGVRERAGPRRRLLPDAAGVSGGSTRSGSRPRRRAACSTAARSRRASSGTPTARRSTRATAS